MTATKSLSRNNFNISLPSARALIALHFRTRSLKITSLQSRQVCSQSIKHNSTFNDQPVKTRALYDSVEINNLYCNGEQCNGDLLIIALCTACSGKVKNSNKTFYPSIHPSIQPAKQAGQSKIPFNFILKDT